MLLYPVSGRMLVTVAVPLTVRDSVKFVFAGVVA